MFQVDSYPDRTFQAEVRYISPVVTNDTRSMVVEAVADNSDGALRPGCSSRPNWSCRAADRDLGFRRGRAEIRRSGAVFVVRDGVAREQVVALGEEAEGKV